MRIGDILIFCLLTYPKADRITKIQVSIFSFFFFQSKENITYPPHESFFFFVFLIGNDKGILIEKRSTREG